MHKGLSKGHRAGKSDSVPNSCHSVKNNGAAGARNCNWYPDCCTDYCTARSSVKHSDSDKDSDMRTDSGSGIQSDFDIDPDSEAGSGSVTGTEAVPDQVSDYYSDCYNPLFILLLKGLKPNRMIHYVNDKCQESAFFLELSGFL